MAAANPNTVVVLNTGDPVFMPWVDDVKAILEMWYPGQRGGPATANVLLGHVNPSGKLPGHLPGRIGSAAALAAGRSQLHGHHRSTAIARSTPARPQPGFISVTNHNYRTIDYTTNGIFVGYRWYDQNKVTPLFPFGHGLSYTKFSYSRLSVTPAADGGLDVSFRVHNVGNADGDEVAQVYIGPAGDAPAGSSSHRTRSPAFDRVSLKNGEKQDVTLHIAPRQLSYWSTDAHDWVVGTGTRTVSVGSSSRDIRLEADAVVAAP